MNEGVGKMGRFEFEAAGSAFEAALALRPESRFAALDRAISVLNRTATGSQSRALELFSEILKTDPRALRANYCSAIALLYLGRPQEAVPHLQVVQEQAPDDAYGNYFLAQALEQSGLLEQARLHYRTVTELDPFLRSAWLGLQRTEARLGDQAASQKALDTFEELGRNPRSRLAEFRYSRMGPLAMAMLESTPAVSTSARTVSEAFLSGATIHEGLVGREGSLQVVDLLGDGTPEIIVAGGAADGRSVLLQLEDSSDQKWGVVADHPLGEFDRVNSMLFGDVDANGTVDAFLCRTGENLLLLQSPEGRWSLMPGLPDSGADTGSGVIADLDHDGDLDVFCTNRDGANALLNNNGDGTFRDIAGMAGVAGPDTGSVGVLVADLDLDRDADLVVLATRPPHAVYLNDRLWNYSRSEAFSRFESADLVAVAACYGTESGMAHLRSLDREGMVHSWIPPDRDSRFWVPIDGRRLESGPMTSPRALSLLDVTGNGVQELLVQDGSRIEVLDPANQVIDSVDLGSSLVSMDRILLDAVRGCGLAGLTASGDVRLLQASAQRDSFASVRFSGREDPAQQMRSNTSGIGVRWAARLGSRWQAGATWSASTSPGQGLQPWAIGLGSESMIEFLEIIWPDGVFQTELGLGSGSHPITEIQRQISSCPLVFMRSKDARSFDFLTDVLGVGGMGYLLAPGVTAPPRPHETLLLPGAPAELRLAEPMEEACYLDQLSVLSIDVPDGLELVLDERLATSAPEATSRPLLVEGVVEVDQALNHRGEDMTDAVRSWDLMAADPGAIDARYIGLLEDEHLLELRFEQPIDQADLLLVEGWVEYPYSQTSFAAWQAGRTYHPTSLEALEPTSGTWIMMAPEFGYPAGMPRSMALPLPPLPEGCRALRLRTNQEVYWDRIRLATQVERPLVATPLPITSAEVAWCGFPRRTTGPQRQPHYDYQQRDQFGDMRHQAGFYTEFGPCLPLIDSTDDACAIIGPGEELRVRFADPETPPAAGTRRYWILDLDGWCKDMDLFTVEGEQLEPLPARSGNGPSEEARRLMRRYNSRFASGR
ncbi:MAG: FG-GAP-like repeat-containing protein [Planctomycetota bacterium]|nr:FG-GAP-like repeat-containing protein [Planctomycetota bacterium]